MKWIHGIAITVIIVSAIACLMSVTFLSCSDNAHDSVVSVDVHQHQHVDGDSTSTDCDCCCHHHGKCKR